MSMTDPIADMLVRIKNAAAVGKPTVKMPSSKTKVAIADVLKDEGYIAGWSVEDAQVGKTLILELKYTSSRERALSGIRRISKPGLRVYAKSTELPKVLGGLGIAIISTSQGIMSDKQARKAGLGGEVIAYVW